MGQQEQEPASWGALLQSYRTTHGSRALSTIHDAAAAAAAAGAPASQQPRLVRTVPEMCPLAETRHRLYTSGEPRHEPNERDGSLQRARRHGWGDRGLLRGDGAGDGSAAPPAPSIYAPDPGPDRGSGRAPARPPVARDGRCSLFGTLSGAEAGGLDSWVGHPSIDPSKGRRAASPPRDPKGRRGLAAVLSLANPGKPDDDAWLGCIGLDPARGRRRVQQQRQLGATGGGGSGAATASAPASLFGVLQPGRPAAAWEVGGANSGSSQDAWIGNRAIAPGSGKRAAQGSGLATAAAASWFFGGTSCGSSNNNNNDGGGGTITVSSNRVWSDLPKIGRRPLPEPPSVAGAPRAADALRPLLAATQQQQQQQEGQQPAAAAAAALKRGKRELCEYRRPGAGEVRSLMTAAAPHQPPLSTAAAPSSTWDDAARAPRRRPPPADGSVWAGQHGSSGGGGGPAAAGLLEWAPSRAPRFVPFGGLAQEAGMSLNAAAAIAAITSRKGGGTMAPRGVSGSGGRAATRRSGAMVSAAR